VIPPISSLRCSWLTAVVNFLEFLACVRSWAFLAFSLSRRTPRRRSGASSKTSPARYGLDNLVSLACSLVIYRLVSAFVCQSYCSGLWIRELILEVI
jgi:hypothetical protein